jgi:hypothetical protein
MFGRTWIDLELSKVQCVYVYNTMRRFDLAL